MVSAFAFWTEAKQDNLCQELTGYWAEDSWDLPHCPINLPLGYLGRSRFLTFQCPSQNVKTELKYVCRQKFIQGEWKVNASIQQRVHRLVGWMLAYLPATTRSLLERDLNEWEQSYDSYLTAQGRPVVQKRKQLRASQQFKEYTVVDPYVSLLRQIYGELEQTYDTRAEYDKDVWDFHRLGVRVSAGNAGYKANFGLIRQPWLRQLAKTCLRYRLALYSAADCYNKVAALAVFSDFLAGQHPQAGPQHLTRELMLEYSGFLRTRNLSPSTRRHYLIDLRSILELAVRMEWGEIPTARIIFEDDLPCLRQPVPRFIPDPVFKQIFLHLEKLEPHWRRMFLVAYEVGMRIGELLSLPFNCVLQDATGNWWIQYFQEKVKTEQSQPIAPETAAVIQAQQQESLVRLGYRPEWLFPNSHGKRWRGDQFRNAINHFIIQNEIRDASGALWRFQPHQLRHSFGTRQINRGMPILTLMRMMGHRSEKMTETYAHLHEQTLQVEFERARLNRKLVDIAGRVIAETSPADAVDLQWLKSHMDARTLANGYCGIPVVLGPCGHPNSCLTCHHFRTDTTHLPIHEDQLVETIRLIEVARARGWETQVENNERIARSLKTIIAALKEGGNEA